VGENLNDHYQSRVVVKLKDRISLNDDVRNPLRLLAMGMEWLFKNSGPLTAGRARSAPPCEASTRRATSPTCSSS
jgi:hypothetical protein